MSSKQAALVPVERYARDISASAPSQRVYIGNHPTAGAGHYVFVTLASEATAWLKETSADVFKFDTDSAFDNGKPLLVSTAPNTIIL